MFISAKLSTPLKLKVFRKNIILILLFVSDTYGFQIFAGAGTNSCLWKNVARGLR